VSGPSIVVPADLLVVEGAVFFVFLFLMNIILLFLNVILLLFFLFLFFEMRDQLARLKGLTLGQRILWGSVCH
jgi:hypothetical protein